MKTWFQPSTPSRITSYNVCYTKLLRDDPGLDLQVIVTGLHLTTEFGFTYRRTEQDGFPVTARVDSSQRGDDFLAKPYSFTVLSARVTAMERIHALHQSTRALYSRMQRDQEIAEQVFSNAVVADNVALEQIRSLLRPANVFSGDLLLTAFAPSHDLP